MNLTFPQLLYVDFPMKYSVSITYVNSFHIHFLGLVLSLCVGVQLPLSSIPSIPLGINFMTQTHIKCIYSYLKFGSIS